MNESAPSALYRQHHDVEVPRVDDRHFRPAWRVLTRLDGLLAEKAITAAEWHAAADFRVLWDQVALRTAALADRTRSTGIAGHRAFDGSLAGELDAHNACARSAGASAPSLAHCFTARSRGTCHGPRSGGSIAATRKPRALG
jgi:hypothetical protein